MRRDPAPSKCNRESPDYAFCHLLDTFDLFEVVETNQHTNAVEHYSEAIEYYSETLPEPIN